MAGDYEVSLPGVYGDDMPLPETNRELVPLLQRLIKLLQEGAPVMLNTAGQVVSGGYAMVGGGTYTQASATGGAVGQPGMSVTGGGVVTLTGK